jgi:hypothetical protein
MPAIVEWYLPKKVLVCHSFGDIKDEDLQIADEALLAHLDEAEQAETHILFNFSQLTGTRFSAGALIKNLKYLKHSKLGWVVIYGRDSNRVVNFLLSIVSQTTRMRYQEFPTYAEALAFLSEQDPSLDFSGYGPPVLRSEGEIGTPFK